MPRYARFSSSAAGALVAATALSVMLTAQSPAPKTAPTADTSAAASAVTSLQKLHVINDPSEFSPGVTLTRAAYLKLLYGALKPSVVPKELLRPSPVPSPRPSASVRPVGADSDPRATPAPNASPAVNRGMWYNPLFTAAKHDQLLATLPAFTVASAKQPVKREEVAVTAILLALREGAIHPGPVPATFPDPKDIDGVREENRDAVRLAIYFGCVPLDRYLHFNPGVDNDGPGSALCVKRLQKKPNAPEVK